MNASRQLATPIPNSYWVISGRFAAGEYPGARATGEATAKLPAFLSAGVDHFIDLTEPGELIPYSDLARREANRLNGAIGYERYPIVDLSVPKRPGQMARILDAIDVALDAGRTV